MRPLARWTMGKVSEWGWELLSESIRLFQKIYPEFDLIVCYNNLSLEEQIRLKSFGVSLYKQDMNQAEFPFKENTRSLEVKNFAWKLIPSRLRPESHELWIDNDIVIRKKIPQVDEWLDSDAGIISAGYNRDYGRFSSSMINENCCAGFFGLPPLFDFKSEIEKYCKGEPLWGFDEQGLVSLIVCNMKRYTVIPHKELDMMGSWCSLQRARKMANLNIHFVRANQRDSVKHPAWTHYKIMTTP